MAQDLSAALAKVATQPAPLPEPVRPQPHPASPNAPPRLTPVPDPNQNPPVDRLSAPQQRILDALLAFEAVGLSAVAKRNVAVWSDQSPTSSGYTNNLGALRSLGLIEYPAVGQVALTEAGRALARPVTPITSIEQLHQAWYARLPNPQARILRVLIECYPSPVERLELAEAAGQSPTSSGYTNNLGRLRSLGLIDYPRPGQAVATALLFPPYLV